MSDTLAIQAKNRVMTRTAWSAVCLLGCVGSLPGYSRYVDPARPGLAANLLLQGRKREQDDVILIIAHGSGCPFEGEKASYAEG